MTKTFIFFQMQITTWRSQLFRHKNLISPNSLPYLRSWKRFLKNWLFYFTKLSILWVFKTANSCEYLFAFKASHEEDDNLFLKTLLVSVNWQILDARLATAFKIIRWSRAHNQKERVCLSLRKLPHWLSKLSSEGRGNRINTNKLIG